MRIVNLPLGSPAVSRVIDNTMGHLRRLSVRETTGVSGAVIELYDGTGTNGQLIDTLALSAGQSTRDYYRMWEYPYYSGLYLSVVSGTVTGAVVTAHSHNWPGEGEPVLIVGTLNIDLPPAPGA